MDQCSVPSCVWDEPSSLFLDHVIESTIFCFSWELGNGGVGVFVENKICVYLLWGLIFICMYSKCENQSELAKLCYQVLS